MNVRNDVIINSPNNKNETCTEFVIDDITKPFMLNGTTEVGEDYTFSAWIKSSEESSINIYGESIPITNEWKRKRVTFNATGRGIRIYFDKVGTYYFYKSQLELGKVMSDASPSPEDIKASLEVKINKENLISEINASADIIRLTGDRLIIDSKNLQVAEDGTITANNGKFTGELSSTKGSIGGFDINGSSLSKLDSNGYGIIVGTSGINTISETGSALHKSYYSEYKFSNSDVLSTIVSGAGMGFYSESKDGMVTYSDAAFYKNDTYKGSINCDGFFDTNGDRFIEWNGKMKPTSIKSNTFIAAGTRIYLPNGKAIRGMKAGYDITDTISVENSDIIAYLSEGNRVILGAVENTAPTEIRSPSIIYLKCNATTADDENRYAIGFSKVNFGSSDSSVYYGCFRPRIDNLTVIGSTNFRFRNIYSTNGVNTESDRNKKHDINNLAEKYYQFFDLLTPVTFIRNTGDRVHAGFISQDVENALLEVGLSDKEFAGFCKDLFKDDEGVAILDENGNEQYIYSLRYEEFIALNTGKIKQIESEMNNFNSETLRWKDEILVQLEELKLKMEKLNNLLE